MPMSQAQFIERLKEEHDACVEISRRKNNDYSTNNDAFLNFRGSTMVGVDPAQAILVRMSDKMARAGQLLQKEAMVKDESINDTLRDLANYALILVLFLEDRAASKSLRTAVDGAIALIQPTTIIDNRPLNSIVSPPPIDQRYAAVPKVDRRQPWPAAYRSADL